MEKVISIPKELSKAGELVLIPRKEYEKLKKMVIPVYQLKGKAARNLDKLVKEGLRDHGLGKTRKIKSLSDLE